jgi:4-hydroxybenzoate decarboxylase subunit C
MAKRAFHSLQQFLHFLKREGELQVISSPVDPTYEASTIAVRSMLEGGKALLFENVIGTRFPLAMNVLASDRRVELAISEDPDTLGGRLLHMVEELMPPSPSKLFNAARPLFSRLIASRVRRSSSGEVSQFTLDDKLASLPILKTWPDDGGNFITLPQVFTHDPRTGKRNVGMYRMHVFDNATTGMHWQIQKGGGFHYRVAEELNRPLEVAVAVGTDPALLLATIAPLPEGIDEVMFAGFLRGEPTRMSRARSIGMQIPAEAEFILEGVVPPYERRLEGPFGDHFGHYSHAGMFPVFHIRQVSHRSNAIFAATVVGKPPMEDKWLGDATQHILGPLARLTHPEVTDLWAFYEAGFHNLLGIAAKQRYGKEAMKTAMSLVTDAQLSLTKCAIVVDEHVKVRNFRQLVRQIANNFDPYYDCLILNKVPLDTLDFTSYTMNLGSKMLIDATTKLESSASGGKYPVRRVSMFFHAVGMIPLPSLTIVDPRIIEWIQIEDALLVVKVPGPYRAETNAAKMFESGQEVIQKTVGREVIERLVNVAHISHLPKGVKIVAAVSEDVNLSSDIEIMWGIFTRFDAARDVVFTKTKLEGATLVYDGIMGIDATWKPGFPNPCETPAEVEAHVASNWSKYGF